MGEETYSVPIRGAVEVQAETKEEALEKALMAGDSTIEIVESFDPVKVGDLGE